MFVDAAGQGEIILHFGMQKTGSTAIQSALYRHLTDARGDPRFAYIHFGTANSSPMLVAGFGRKPEAFHQYRLGGTPASEIARLKEQALARLGEELTRVGTRAGVLSAESLSNFTETELEGLCAAIERQGGRRIRAVGYLRRPTEFMGSAFQQRLKADLAQWDLDRLYPGYRRRLGKFDSVLGQANVELWLFDPRRFPGGCVVQDFCRRLGITMGGSAVKRVNESLSLSAVALLYAYRKLGEGHGVGVQAQRDNESLIRELSRLEGPRFRWHPVLVDPVLSRQREDIRWAEARLGESLGDEAPADVERAVRSEADLLRCAAEAGRALAQRLGRDDLVPTGRDMEPPEVAALVHALKEVSARGAAPGAGGGGAG